MIETNRNTHKAYLGLGSNLGNRAATITKAVKMIGERVGKVARQSSLIETEPWGFASEHRFLNGVVLVETQLSPRELLRETQHIERSLGRKKGNPHSPALDPQPYSDRPIDIDILLYDDLTIAEPDLVIPHPLMQERDFVMRPLREIQQEY